VEADKNTSTIIPASCKRRQNGNPVVSDETVMYGYDSSATLTTDRLRYKLQTRKPQGLRAVRRIRYIEKKKKLSYWDSNP
jgi:hypothetical protein